MATNTFTTDLENRSEIIFLYDAIHANPNGDPLSANDMPRIDTEVGEAIVTDSRLKRYVRDQLTDEPNPTGDRGVYLLNPDKNREKAHVRDELFLNLLGLTADDVDDMTEQEVLQQFLESSLDVRYFGAVLSFSEDLSDWAKDNLSSSGIHGPIQFRNARSMHEVVLNDESSKLSSTTASKDSSDQGTFAEDNRLEYALINFHGFVNEVAASNTGLDSDDVELLDGVFWRSLVTQTLTRSKMEHNPRLYMRVETDGMYQAGQLDKLLEIDEEHSANDRELRNISDVVLNIDALIDRLSCTEVNDRLKKIVVHADYYTEFSYDGEVGGRELLYDALRENAPSVEVFDPHDR